MKKVAAIVLAAGRSRRMGNFKPLLPFGDKTVIESCITNLRAAGIDEIVVVIGHRADEVQKQLENSNVSFARNPDPNSEMSASIAVGVNDVGPNANALLIVLVDHPAVPSSIIKQLIEGWEQTKKRLVQPQFDGRGGHPVLIDLALRAELMSLNPEQGLRGLFERHRNEVHRVIVDSPYVARDMDTWEDYLRLHQDVFGRSPDKA